MPMPNNNNNRLIALLRLVAIVLAVTFLFYEGMRIGSKIEINITYIHEGKGESFTNNAKLRGDSRTSSPLISSIVQQNNNNVNDDNSDDASEDGGGLSSSSSSATIDNVSAQQQHTTIPMNIDDMIPNCAQDLFITLLQQYNNDESSSSEEESSSSQCKGMLIRDDIILTTRECSNDTFHFGEPVLSEAVPHTILNNKKKKESSSSSRFGFLKVQDANMHYYFIDQAYYRTRMFLSLKSTSTINNDDGKDDDNVVVITCDVDDEHKPIVHNFPANGGREMIPIHELYGVVPDDILWEHVDLYTAPTLKMNHIRWWTKAIRINVDEDYIKKKFVEYSGPLGSISIPDAHGKFVGKASSLCEVLDPRGHRAEQCFNHYFILWREEQPFSGMHFFDWLDYGNGKHILERNFNKLQEHDPATFEPWEKDKHCVKEKFNEKTVHYFNDREREFHEVYITQSKDGTQLIWRYKNNNELVPSSDINEPHLYMWDLEKKFYIVDKRWNKEKFGEVKHTGIMNGMPALSGGEAYFGENGAIWGINWSSGHYRPDIEAIAMLYQWTKEHGYNTTALHWVGSLSDGWVWSEKDCNDTDWEKDVQVDGFDAASLEISCREVINSPTWILRDVDGQRVKCPGCPW